MSKKSSKQSQAPSHDAALPVAVETVRGLQDPAQVQQMSCAELERSVNSLLYGQGRRKLNALQPCDDRHGDCSCGQPNAPGVPRQVDLVILLESTAQMATHVPNVYRALVDGLGAAVNTCKLEPRLTWLVVDAKKPGADPAGTLGSIAAALASTPFKQTHQQYLVGIGRTGPFKQDQPQPSIGQATPGAEGADAIADLCKLFDWRPNACRAIFYVGNSPLDGNSTFDVAAAANATAAALSNGVVLFAHCVTSPSTNSAAAPYRDMCQPTGGIGWGGSAESKRYAAILTDAICRVCGSDCHEWVVPPIEPCISIRWGDSACDGFETDDTETAIITVCNCFSNVSFANVHVAYLHITQANGKPVPLLPDGTPAVSVHPPGPICFGDIGPCHPGALNCVSREIVIRTRGAKKGSYKLVLSGVCFQVVLARQSEACFALTLCGD